jgi:hypothetical protein
MNILLMSIDCAPTLMPGGGSHQTCSSIAGNIEGHNVYVADLILRRIVAETVKELITEYQPDVVGLTAMSFQFATARESPVS